MSHATIRESTIVVDGAGVHLLTAGRGPALILVHGLVGSARNWMPNIVALAEFRTVYALDLANMGESDRVAGLDPGLEASADRIAACMDVLGIDSADIGAHSHGGAIALMLAVRHPGRVRRLVLFAPANPFCDLSRQLIAFYSTQVGRLFARLIPFFPRKVHDFAHRRMYVDRRRVTPEMLDGYTAGLNTASILHILGIIRQWTKDMALLRGVLNQIAGLPTLLIWGDRDFAVGPGSGQRLAEVLGAKLLVIPGAGHLPFVEQPEICHAAIRQWLE